MYTAYSIPTAIAEVSPFIGAEVSVAEITVLENLEILSFCAWHSSTTLDGKNDDVLKWKNHLMYYDLMNMAKMRCCTPYVSPEDYDRMVRFTESAIADDKWDIINKFLQLGNRALSKQDMEKN